MSEHRKQRRLLCYIHMLKKYFKTKSDSFPILRIDDYIDKIGHAKFVSKLDLLKGFWQVSLTEQAKKTVKICHSKGSLSIQDHAIWNEKCTSCTHFPTANQLQ